jgi:hypothetical protein
MIRLIRCRMAGIGALPGIVQQEIKERTIETMSDVIALAS